MNGKEIVISKYYGLVKAIGFDQFKLEINYSITAFQQYELLTNELISSENPELKASDINKLEVGDEVHISYNYQSVFNPNSFPKLHENQIKVYLSKTIKNDSIIYEIENKVERIQTDSKGEVTVKYFTEQRKEICVNYSWLDVSPEILYKHPSVNFARNHLILNGPLGRKKLITMDNNFFGFHLNFQTNLDTCAEFYLSYMDGEGYLIEGLGTTNSNYSYKGDIEEFYNIIVYFKNGNQTWGSPFLFTDTKETLKANEIKMYPNPAENMIYFKFKEEFSESLDVKIISVYGTCFLEKSLLDASSIDISKLPPGIYSAFIFQKGELRSVQKFIKK